MQVRQHIQSDTNGNGVGVSKMRGCAASHLCSMICLSNMLNGRRFAKQHARINDHSNNNPHSREHANYYSVVHYEWCM